MKKRSQRIVEQDRLHVKIYESFHKLILRIFRKLIYENDLSAVGTIGSLDSELMFKFILGFTVGVEFEILAVWDETFGLWIIGEISLLV